MDGDAARPDSGLGEPDQNPAQASEIDELKVKLRQSDFRNDRLQSGSAQASAERTRLGAKSQASANTGAARQDEAPDDPKATKQTPGAPPRSAPAESETRSRRQSPTPDQTKLWPPPRRAPRGRRAGSERKPYLRVAGLIFAASPRVTGSLPIIRPRRRTSPFVLNATKENPIENRAAGPAGMFGLNLKGSHISPHRGLRLASGYLGFLSDLREPVKTVSLKWSTLGEGTVIYDVGRHHYTYSTKTGKWDHLDLGR